jgi:hypothetical protein
VDLVFLHGPPAAGKLTTARELERLVGLPVFHNHLVVDLLTGLFPFGSEAFVRLREQFWLAVFTEAAGVGRSLTFTFTPDRTVAPGFPHRVREAVEPLGGRVRFVRLVVSAEEQERRIDRADRRAFHKVTDVGFLHRARAGAPPEQPPTELEVDTDTSAPATSAATIIERFGLRWQPAQERYPRR